MKKIYCKPEVELLKGVDTCMMAGSDGKTVPTNNTTGIGGNGQNGPGWLAPSARTIMDDEE